MAGRQHREIRAERFHPFLYWTVIAATTLAGTTMADLFDRLLGIGYLGVPCRYSSSSSQHSPSGDDTSSSRVIIECSATPGALAEVNSER
jgi:hypothetical protein